MSMSTYLPLSYCKQIKSIMVFKTSFTLFQFPSCHSKHTLQVLHFYVSCFDHRNFIDPQQIHWTLALFGTDHRTLA